MNLFELSAVLRMDTKQFEQSAAQSEKRGRALSQNLGRAFGGVSKAASGIGSVAGKIGSGVQSVANTATSAVGKVASLGGKVFSVGEKAFQGLAKVGVGAIKGVGTAATGAVHAVEGIGKAALAATGAITALGAAFVPMIKQSVSAYADYEQLVGGVQTLFKDSAHRVLLDAQDAYKTAGMSANQYMEMVTSFSASMIQSLGGDTEKAAELSNMAITDMADNANKMGSDMESVQNAYRGFSKQNFTMLDNLKLGYGGTEKEMKRLLKDAEKISGVHYDISSYADIVQAIHVVQTEMGITETTAKEAKETISGSLGMVKASWQNVITAMAGTGSSRNFNNIIKQFTDSLETFLGNVTPAAQRAVAGFKTVVERLAPVIAETLPGLVETLLPDLIDTGFSVATSIFSGITKTFSGSNLRTMLKKITGNFKKPLLKMLNIPQWIGQENRAASWGDIAAKLGEKLREALSHVKDHLKVGLAQLLGLEVTSADEVTWAEIGRAVVEAIKRGFGYVKVTVANMLGITNDGKQITSADEVTWGQIALAVHNRIAENLQKLPTNLAIMLGMKNPDGSDITQNDNVSWGALAGHVRGKIIEKLQNVRVTLANLLGMKNPDGSDITSSDAVSWDQIAQNIGQKIRKAMLGVKVTLANLLGIKNPDGSEITSADQVSWGAIAKHIRNSIKNALGTLKITLAEIIGLTDVNGKPIADPSWSQIGHAMLTGIMKGLTGTNDFLKRLLIGDDAYRELQSGIKGKLGPMGDFITDAMFGDVEVGWGDVVDKIFSDLNKVFSGDFFSDLATLSADAATGIGKFAINLAMAFGTALGTEGVGTTFATTITGLISSALEAAPSWIANLNTFVSEFIAEFTKPETFDGIVTSLTSNATNIITSIANALETVIPTLVRAFVSILGNTDFQNAVFKLVKTVYEAIKNGLADLFVTFVSGGRYRSYSEIENELIKDAINKAGGTTDSRREAAAQVIVGEAEARPGVYGDWASMMTALGFGRGTFNTFEGDVTGYLSDSYRKLANEETTDQEYYATLLGLKEFQDSINAGMDHNEAVQAAQAKQTEAMSQTTDALYALLTGGTLDRSGYKTIWRSYELPEDDPRRGTTRHGRHITSETGQMFIPEGDTEAGWKAFANILEAYLGRPVTNNELQRLIDSGIHLDDAFEASVASMNLDAATVTIDGATINYTINGRAVAQGNLSSFSPYGDMLNDADSSNAKGLWSVPYDNYTTRLHRDEMVLTASQARDYRDGMMGDSTAIVAAIEGLRNDMQNLKLVVGRKTFGQATVDYGGRRMQGYIGQAENRAIAGYGWG